VPVELAAITRATVRDSSELTGTLEPSSQFTVAPKIQGRLERLLANIGDTVENGQLIAILDSEEYAQQVAAARAELDVSKANLSDSRSSLDTAARDLQRVQELRKQKVASAAELDEAEARHQAAIARHAVAAAQLKQKEAALKAAEVRLSYTQIRVAWEGHSEQRRIAERFIHEGAMLRANDPIVSVVDLNTVIAVINVVEQDFSKISVGQAAVITTGSYPGRTFTGSVVRRAPVLSETTRQARVEIAVPNEDGLLAPGMFVRVLLQFAEREHALVVPTSSLVQRGGMQGVFMADEAESNANFVPVEIGISTAELTEIVHPELTGMIVTLGHHLLEDGAEIAAVKPRSNGQGSNGNPRDGGQEGSR